MLKARTVFIFLFTFLLFICVANAQEKNSVSVKTDIYEIYAPNDNELKTAQEEVQLAADTFEKYFGEKPPKIAVIIVDSPGEVPKIDFSPFMSRGLKILPFVSNDYLKKIEKPGTQKKSMSEARPLSHEAGHKFFITYVNKNMTKTASNTTNLKYGHPEIPDWFDEAIATLSEYPNLKKRRNNFLKENLDKTIPLEEFFEMEHPYFARNKVKLGGKKVLSGEEAKEFLKNNPNIIKNRSGVAKVTVVQSDKKTSPKDLMFYSQSLAFTEFLVDKKGNSVVKDIANGLMNGKKATEILATIDSRYENLENLENDWKAWVKSQKSSE